MALHANPIHTVHTRGTATSFDLLEDYFSHESLTIAIPPHPPSTAFAELLNYHTNQPPAEDTIAAHQQIFLSQRPSDSIV
ncbi:uncharacterized protein N0V89_012529 [Didymosphaeria variabile]|uniref:Uncharacterized protein n=1 Tax=Didymosphaeria variabile TaxID=1932322 RepID=A0A9W8XAT9_9PLEO|nr:uncharacterized protein N0V89_012529 [Didymosphaeria variabile]KAJ4344785.1 hypothetical protein N0V89_012529 [Didymosphaeria variabile]